MGCSPFLAFWDLARTLVFVLALCRQAKPEYGLDGDDIVVKLPNGGMGLVPKAKVVDYLLSFTHRYGRSKAAFFSAHGFQYQRWEEMSQALRRHAAENEIAEPTETPFGRRYVIDGNLLAPDGAGLRIRSVWFLETGIKAPRFVTAHPLPRRRT